MERGRAFRRNCEKKAKQRAKNSMMAKWPMENVVELNDRRIGRLASTHCKPCSCYMCCNFRKTEGATLQEKRSDLDMKEE